MSSLEVNGDHRQRKAPAGGCVSETNMWRVRDGILRNEYKEVGEKSLGSLHVRARVTLERMMTLFRADDVHQGI